MSGTVALISISGKHLVLFVLDFPLTKSLSIAVAIQDFSDKGEMPEYGKKAACK